MSALADFRQRCLDTIDSSARPQRTDREILRLVERVDAAAPTLRDWLLHPGRHDQAMRVEVSDLLATLRHLKREERR